MICAFFDISPQHTFACSVCQYTIAGIVASTVAEWGIDKKTQLPHFLFIALLEAFVHYTMIQFAKVTLFR